MGQRFQVITIARIIAKGGSKPYYRCIAAHHHQWCYGKLPVLAIYPVLELLKSPINAMIVRDEIRRANGLYGRIAQGVKMPLHPCPYTAFLVAQAWDVDLSAENGTVYATGMGFERGGISPNLYYTRMDNNDGWAIVDVTDPTDPGVCFLAGGSPRDPITPREYLEMDQDPGEIGDAVLDALDAVRLLGKHDLAEAFPKLFKSISQSESGDEATATEAGGVPSLVALAAQAALQAYLDNPDDPKTLEHLDVAAHREDLLDMLRPQQPFPDSRVDVLVKLVCDDDSTGVLRITGFTGLSNDQIGTILSKVNVARGSPIHTLDLSGATNLDGEKLLATLSKSAPSLRRIILLNTNITVKEMDNLLDHYASPSDSNNSSNPATPTSSPSGTFTFLRTTLRPIHEQQNTSSSLRFFHPDKVLHMVIKFAEAAAKNPPDNSDNPFGGGSMGGGVMDNSMLGRILMGAGYPLSSGGDGEDLESWGTRAVTSLPPIEDMSVLKGDGWAFLFVFSGTSFVRTTSPEVQGWTFLKVHKEAYQKWVDRRWEMAREWEAEHFKEKAGSDEAGAAESTPESTSTESTKPAMSPSNPHRQPAFYPPDVFTIHTVRSFADALVAEGRPAASPALIEAAEKALANLEKTINKKARQRPQANQSNVMAMIMGSLSGAIEINDLADLRFDEPGSARSGTGDESEEEDVPGAFGGSKEKSFRMLEKRDLGPFLWEGEPPRMARPMASVNPGGSGFSIVVPARG